MTKTLPKDKAKARVAIARDVIKRIQAEKLIARTGSYISPVRAGPLSSPDEVEECCAVCAIGAAAISYVRLFNRFELPVKHGHCGRRDLAEILSGVFSRDGLDEIESAFECRPMWRGWSSGPSDESAKRVAPFVKFGERYPDDADRLLAICQNIVDHDGEFRPEVEDVITQE